MKAMIAISFGAALLMSATARAQSVRVLTPDEGSKALESYFPRDKKSVRLDALAYNEKSSQTTKGISKAGDLEYSYFYSLEIAIPAPSKPASYNYSLTVGCSETRVWDRCGLPPQHVLIAVTLKRGKHGEFDALLPSESRLGGKIEVSTFHVIEVRRVEQTR
jgi:hypothetical protein